MTTNHTPPPWTAGAEFVQKVGNWNVRVIPISANGRAIGCIYVGTDGKPMGQAWEDEARANAALVVAAGNGRVAGPDPLTAALHASAADQQTIAFMEAEKEQATEDHALVVKELRSALEALLRVAGLCNDTTDDACGDSVAAHEARALLAKPAADRDEYDGTQDWNERADRDAARRRP